MSVVMVADAVGARDLTDRIKVAVEGTWHLIVEAYQSRAWAALGYQSWDDYCTREFGTARLRLPREERVETVQSLRDAGLSLRAISAATGDSVTTIRRGLAGVPNGTPAEPVREAAPVIDVPEVHAEAEPTVPPVVDYSTGQVLEEVAGPEPVTPAEKHPTVTGIDGKTYTPTAPRKPPRKPLIDTAKSRGFALRQATDSLLRVFEDDRYRTNEKQVADALRGHLLYVAETVAAVLDQLP